MPRANEPANLIQSVSMELERLTTLMEYGIKRGQDVMLLVQEGLTDDVMGSLGSVCRGLLEEKVDDYDIVPFAETKATFLSVFHFCYRCAEKRWE